MLTSKYKGKGALAKGLCICKGFSLNSGRLYVHLRPSALLSLFLPYPLVSPWMQPLFVAPLNKWLIRWLSNFHFGFCPQTLPLGHTSEPTTLVGKLANSVTLTLLPGKRIESGTIFWLVAAGFWDFKSLWDRHRDRRAVGKSSLSKVLSPPKLQCPWIKQNAVSETLRIQVQKTLSSRGYNQWFYYI